MEIDDMQGLLISAYTHLPCTAYLLLQLNEPAPARQWLGRLLRQLTVAENKREDWSLNIAFTASGLLRAGMPEVVLDGFSFPFREGMAEQHRTRVLGDIGENAPENWYWGAPHLERIDVLLLVYARDEPGLNALVAQLSAEFASSGIRAVKELYTGHTTNREHFGFVDDISQPVIQGEGPFHHVAQKTWARTGVAKMIKPGEFILGYEDESGQLAPVSTLMVGGKNTDNPAATEFGRNGSYLAFRHFAQHVGLFRAYVSQSALDANGNPDPEAAKTLAAKMVGRWPEGAALAITDNPNHPHSTANEFTYDDDPQGLRCPIGAHIRRANPRDSLDPVDPIGGLARVQRRRLLRRGRSFGPPLPPGAEEDNIDRGLHFICLCSDLERQFEFVQQTWLNNPSFGDLSRETDPLTGPHSPVNCFTVPSDPVPARHCNLQQFVTVKGGAYFLLPGIKALERLVSGSF